MLFKGSHGLVGHSNVTYIYFLISINSYMFVSHLEERKTTEVKQLLATAGECKNIMWV